MSESWLVTGALGCIGAWVCRTLVHEGIPVVAYDLGEDTSRLELVLHGTERERVTLVRGDVTDLAGLESALAEHGITHVVHLAAMLIPLAAADPPRGAHVNVVGTVNVFEAVRRRGLGGLSYASSAAVYDAADGVRVAEDADGHPVTHYGVHKQANEGTARIFWHDNGVASIGLRPFVVYGPGRDTGLTAGPTLAMRAAAHGEAYRIPFGGRSQLHYAPDAALAFIEASRAAREGAVVRNLGGPPVHMTEVVAAIEAAAPGAAGSITFEDTPLPIPEEFEASQALPTPLHVGVRETIAHFPRGRGMTDVYTAAVADVLDELGFQHQTLPHEIAPLERGMRVSGPAFTVEGRPGTGLEYDPSIRRILELLGAIPAGHVAVYATGDRTCAQFGELSAASLQARGVNGVVLDGGCRDVDFIVRAGFPVFTGFVTPLDAVPRWEVVGWGHDVEIGGVRVATGDWIVGDGDGVVVIPAAVRDEVLARAEAVVGTENEVRKAVGEGVAPLEAYERYGKF